MSNPIRLAGVIRESIVDGPGIRFVVFVQGCPHHCEGCHNPESHDFSGGYDCDPEKILAEIKKKSSAGRCNFFWRRASVSSSGLASAGKRDQKIRIESVYLYWQYI